MKRKVVKSEVCPTCGKAPAKPYRLYGVSGIVVSGCVDHFHAAHLVIPSRDADWHNRPVAKRIRAASRAMRCGFVTEYYQPSLKDLQAIYDMGKKAAGKAK